MSEPKRLSALGNELIDVAKDTWLFAETPGSATGSKLKRMNLLGGGVGFSAKDPTARALQEDTNVAFQLSVEVYDDWDALASDTFTAPVAGLYAIEMRIAYMNQPGGRLEFLVLVGGSVVDTFYFPVTSNPQFLNFQYQTILRFAKGAAVKFLVARPDDGDGTFTISANTLVKCHLV